MRQVLKSSTAIKKFDYVIVGAGSAGCAIANRLTEDSRVRVALLEAGPKDTSPLIHTPAGALAIMCGPKSKLNWYYESIGHEPFARPLKGKKYYQPRGRTLGGSSSTNAMIYIRGNLRDYDEWEELGNTGWGSESALHYFKKSEHNENITDDTRHHAQNGPLNV
jgi:choline dehydrogenase-like flavoprotein